ncbi:MAG TPA: helix-turn-helix domain-containing protein [Tepidisphaeraceae bacterium]|jgi:putative transcriptional regulator|nr:helix-turn-helix domain-containing protein [Tepidisphaeraceae bacterium]
MKRQNTTNAAGRQIMAGIAELEEVLRTGDFSKLTMRTVEIPEPSRYTPKQVKALRQRLGVSQAVFAELLAVSAQLVAHWEYGIRKPAPLACRLLDKIEENPSAYLSSLMLHRPLRREKSSKHRKIA